MNLIIVDTETTGLDPSKHELIEIAAIRVSTGETFEVKVHPLRFTNADPEALKVNGFNRKEWMDDAFLLKHGLKMLTDFVGESPTLMSYNISFDKAFLEAAYRDCKLSYPFHYAPLDLMSLAWHKKGGGNVPSLRKACLLFGIEPEGSVHRALAGAEKAYEVYKKVCL